MKEVHLPLELLFCTWLSELVPARPSARRSSWLVEWAELGDVGLEVLLEESEAELLAVDLEHLAQGWGATEEDLHLALILSG